MPIDDAVSSNGQTPPEGVPVYTAIISEQLGKEIRSHVEEAIGNGNGNGGPPRKSFLGMDIKDWSRWVLSGVMATIIFLAVWYSTVNAAIRERPTRDEASKDAATLVKAHEDHGDHDDLEEIVKGNAAQIRKLSDIQIKQNTIIETQTKTIDRLDKDFRLIRVRTGRNR